MSARRAAGGPSKAEPAADAGPAAPQAPPAIQERHNSAVLRLVVRLVAMARGRAEVNALILGQMPQCLISRMVAVKRPQGRTAGHFVPVDPSKSE